MATTSGKNGKSASEGRSGAGKNSPPKDAAQTSDTKKQGGASETAAGETANMQWLKSYPEGVTWDVKIEAGALHELFDHAVNTYPDNVCTNFFGKKLTYREISTLVDRAARGLQDAGVTKGTKVGLILPNCAYYPVFFFAASRIGATVVNYNPLYAERELIFQIEDSQTDFMVTIDIKPLLDKVDRVFHETRLQKIVLCRMQDALPGLKGVLYPLLKGANIARPKDDHVLYYNDLMDNDGAHDRAKVTPDDIAVLQYTGGTTGVPKGAMLTHGNLTSNCRQIDEWVNFREPGIDRTLAILPFFHVFGMTVVMIFGMYRGSELIILPRFDIGEVLKTIDKERPTVMAGVPTMYQAMLHHPKVSDYDLSSLEFCTSGGAAMPVEVMRAFKKLTGVDILEGYGLTESSPVVCSNPEHGEKKPGSIGIPYPGTTVKIVDIDDPEKEMPQGERGEIGVIGPQVMKGYWGKPEATDEVTVDGMLLTGDIGYLDEDGYVFIVDRKKEMIIASGYNVYPRNVEEAIYEHPAVEECAVVGVPDEYRGQTVKAYIKLKQGAHLDQEKLDEFLKERISAYERPKIVEFVDEPLPKSAVGKILKKELLEAEGLKLGETG